MNFAAQRRGRIRPAHIPLAFNRTYVRSVQFSLNDGQWAALDLAVDASEVLTDDAQEQRIETEGAENKDDDSREAGRPVSPEDKPAKAVAHGSQKSRD